MTTQFGDVKVWLPAELDDTEKVFELQVTDLTLAEARELVVDLQAAIRYVEGQGGKR